MSQLEFRYPARREVIKNSAPNAAVEVNQEIDTFEEVERVYKAQRKLSFTYGVIFFAVTMLIPFLSVTSEMWYGTQVWGGMTLNFLFVSLLFHFIYVGIAVAYTIQANKLEDNLLGKKTE